MATDRKRDIVKAFPGPLAHKYGQPPLVTMSPLTEVHHLGQLCLCSLQLFFLSLGFPSWTLLISSPIPLNKRWAPIPPTAGELSRTHEGDDKHRGHLQVPEEWLSIDEEKERAQDGPHTPGVSEAGLSRLIHSHTGPTTHPRVGFSPPLSRVLILSRCFLNHPLPRTLVPKASARRPLLEGPQAKTPTEFNIGHVGAGWARPTAKFPFMGLGRENNGRAPVEGAVKTIAQSTMLTLSTPIPRIHLCLLFQI